MADRECWLVGGQLKRDNKGNAAVNTMKRQVPALFLPPKNPPVETQPKPW